MKKHWKKIVIGVVIVVVLTVSFFVGGGGTSTQDATGRISVADTGVEPAPTDIGAQEQGSGDTAPGDSSDIRVSEQSNNRQPQQDRPHDNSGVADAQPPVEVLSGQESQESSKQSGDNSGQDLQGEQTSGGASDRGATDSNAQLQDAEDTGLQQEDGAQQAEDPQREMTITLTISVATLLDNFDRLNTDKVGLVPDNGIIFSGTVVFYEGESVFNVLLREVRRNRIHMEHTNNPIYNSAYIEGIGNIYEFDAGDGSGWLYCVNGVFPNYGSSRYILHDGDSVSWLFTCDRGADIGGEGAAGSYNWG